MTFCDRRVLVLCSCCVTCGPASSSDVWGTAAVDLAFVSSLVPERRDCKIAGEFAGVSAMVPPLTAHCGRGPKKRCVRTDAPVESWEYAFPLEDPAWADWVLLGYQPRDKTYFHKQFSWGVVSEECRFTAAVYGDLDDDGLYSTYERVDIFPPAGPQATDFTIVQKVE